MESNTSNDHTFHRSRHRDVPYSDLWNVPYATNWDDYNFKYNIDSTVFQVQDTLVSVMKANSNICKKINLLIFNVPNATFPGTVPMLMGVIS